MEESLVKAFIRGLYGKNTHIDPEKAVEGLTPATAKFRIYNEFHSCWELIHHMVVWQEAIFESIHGNEVDWKKVSKEKNWPNPILFNDDENFEKLVGKFLQGIKTAEEYLKKFDLKKPMPAWSDQPILQAFIVLLQHNSYHLGQLVTVRKTLDI